MTKKRLTNGFTIVEITVVIFVIAILATLTLLAYNIVQKQTRDTKRSNDVKILMGTLNDFYSKNGEYPFSCSYGVATTCVTSNSQYQASTGVTPLSPIGSETTASALTAMFPGLSNNFGSPGQGSANPINATVGGFVSQNAYLFVSPDLYSLGGTVVLNTSPDGSSSISCNFSAIGSGQPHYYVVGYFSEVQNKWVFYRGPSPNNIADLRWNYDSNPACNFSTS